MGSINKDVVSRAKDLAVEEHYGQVDKCGDPYIDHVSNVATRALCNTVYRKNYEEIAEVTIATAWLHDVVEDTKVTIEDIARQFSNGIVLSVEAITHLPNEPYWDYIERVLKNSIAIDVKIADLLDNMRPERIIRITDEATLSRMINILIPRYYKAYKMLVESRI